MNKRLAVLLAVLLLPEVVLAHGNRTPPPISPCALSKAKCQPPGPAKCLPSAAKPCGVNPGPGPNARRA
jgi:hypothetical protein